MAGLPASRSSRSIPKHPTIAAVFFFFFFCASVRRAGCAWQRLEKQRLLPLPVLCTYLKCFIFRCRADLAPPRSGVRSLLLHTRTEPKTNEKVVTGEKVSDSERIEGVDPELLRHYQYSEETNPYPNAPKGEWSTGVFDCFEHFPSCVIAFCCACITTGQVRTLSLYIYIYIIYLVCLCVWKV